MNTNKTVSLEALFINYRAQKGHGGDILLRDLAKFLISVSVFGLFGNMETGVVEGKST